jgi:hypothetical protein
MTSKDKHLGNLNFLAAGGTLKYARILRITASLEIIILTISSSNKSLSISSGLITFKYALANRSLAIEGYAS